LIYFVVMSFGAYLIKTPKEGWTPKGFDPTLLKANNVVQANVDANQALKTPQFYFFWFAVLGNAIAGVSVISCAKTIMADVGSLAPVGFATLYVALLSAANMFGRLGWAGASDYIGRKNTYYIFGLGAAITLLLPTITNMISVGGAAMMAPFSIFVAGTLIIVTFYGGLFSVLPAYLSDIFGVKYVGAIHGRILTAWSIAALTGPTLLSYLRQTSYSNALLELTAKIDPIKFQETFGAPLSDLNILALNKTVTISKLMEIAPPGTIDPTPMIYDTTLYSMSLLLFIAVLCNHMIRPINQKNLKTNFTQ